MAELGNSDRLVIRWPETPGSRRIGPALDVEALYWLKVHPGSVVLSARLKVKVVEGVARQLRLVTDPRLRLLPLRDAAGPIGQVQTTTGDPQIFTLDLARPVTDQANVELDFLLAGTSGIGNLRLPQIEIAEARMTKRWLAVSVDRALVFDEPATERVEAVAVPAFEAAWGKSDAPPTLAYQLPAGPTAWSLATHPDAPRITADQVTTLCFAPGSAKVQFDAQLVTSGYSFQYHLSAPKQLQVERVLVRSESAERAARWSRDAEGGITIFLSESASGRQQLTVSGKMNTPLRGPAMLPLLRVDGTEMHSSEVQVFRDPSVLVEVSDVQGLREADLLASGDDKEPYGRLVKRFMVPDGSSGVSATVTLAPNQPELAVEQLTRLRGDGQSWEVEAHFSVKVSRGVADEFRLQVPSTWSGPYRVEPTLPFRVVSDADNRPRELLLRPQQAIEGEYHFRISGPLTVIPGQRVSVPAITLLGADRSKTLLLLPTQVGSQKVSWLTQGLKEVAAPAGLGTLKSPDAPIAYELENSAFRAVLNPVDHSPPTANVVLADLHFAWQADGSYQGLALFDLEPAGRATAPLHLPADARLLSVRVEGVPATPQSQGQGNWEIPLESPHIPQRIEILLAGQWPDPATVGTYHVEAPSLGSLPVRQTLWSVSGPAEYRARPGREEDTVDPVQMDLLRLQGIAAVTDRIHGLNLSGADAWEKTAPWQAIWRRRWERCRQQIRQESGDGRPPRSAALTTELETLDRKYKELAVRLDPGLGTAGALPFASLDPQLWPARPASPPTTVRCAASPGTSVLVLMIQAAPSPERARLLGVLGGILLVCVASVRRLRRLVAGLACRWPATVGVVVGLIWWLWLAPSIVGLLLILLTFLVWSIPIWRRSGRSRTPTRPVTARP